MALLCVSSLRRMVLVSALSQSLTVRSVHVSSLQLLPHAGRNRLSQLFRCLTNGPHSQQSRVRAHSSAFRHRGSNSKDSGLSLADVADRIKEGLYRRILVMVGAGISTDSGIPDFRSPTSGLYSKLQEYSLPYPEAIFDLSYYLREPHAFLHLSRELLPGRHHPNPAHYFLRLLNDKRLLLRLYTQNIDGLERVAGIPAEKLVEAHGSFSSSTCTMCLKEYPGKTFSEIVIPVFCPPVAAKDKDRLRKLDVVRALKFYVEKVRDTRKTDTLFVLYDIHKDAVLESRVPNCSSCGGLIKPDIVFFGEQLPPRFFLHLTDFPRADLLIVMGTSLEVEPFASLVYTVTRSTPRVLINRDPVGPFLSNSDGLNVLELGEVTSGVKRFVQLLGWEHELEELEKRGKELGSHIKDHHL